MKTNYTLFGNAKDELLKIPDKSIQMCITSPPYYGLRSYSDSEHEIGKEDHPDEYIINMLLVFMQVHRVLKDDGICFINLGDSYYNYRPGKNSYKKQSSYDKDQDLPKKSSKRSNILEGYKEKDLMLIPSQVAHHLREWGWYLRQDIIWKKTRCMPESVKDRFNKTYEHIFMFSKSQSYKFNTEIRNEFLRDVWEIAPASFKGSHFAVFPDKIPEICIKAGSDKGDIILDPFIGTGTTASVAEKLGRKWIGIELNKEYEKFIKERTSQLQLF